VSGRLNEDERGVYLGEFDTGDQIIAIYADGTYLVKELEIGAKVEMDKFLEVVKLKWDTVVSAIYWDGEKNRTFVKRFLIETTSINEKFKFISEASGSKLFFATVKEDPIVSISYKEGGKKYDKEINLAEFIDVKGWRAMGNKLGDFKVLSSKLISSKIATNKPTEDKEDNTSSKYKPGDTIELF
jgi:topoisomerase-4 subunit A